VQPPGGWCVSNAGLLSGGLLIDTAATEERARRLRGAAEQVIGTPRLLVNTHHHGDHTHGNGLFPEAVIIGHDDCPAQMRETGLMITQLWADVEWGEIEVVPPSVTFPDRMSLHLDGLDVELIHTGPAHTTNDVVAWLPEQRILFAGDVVFSGITPFVLMGSVAGSLTALDLLGTLEPEIVVAGHGPVGGPELFDTAERYLRWVQDLAREGIEAGLAPLAVAMETDLGEYGEWLDSERLVGNLHRAYGEEQGTQVENMTAMMEMVTFNGGQLPTCLA
jgi:cyclase